MSFYDWYCDLPPASPETWGEQTDVCESADWYNARFVAVVGSNLNMTRTPDTHFIAEVRHAGAKLTVFSPDFSQVAKYADWWIPANPGQDTAFWLAVDHVLLTELYRDRQVDYFQRYTKRYTDLPFLVQIDGRRPGRYLRADRLERYRDTENGEWKLLMWDDEADEPRMPNGSIGDRWATDESGRWNLELHDHVVGADIEPMLTFIDRRDDTAEIDLEYFDGEVGGGRPGHPFGADPVGRHGRRSGRGHHRARPDDGPVRGRSRATGLRCRRLRRRRRPVHPGLAGEAHRHPPRHRDQVRPGVGPQRRTHRGSKHDHHRGRSEPLVSQQPPVPLRHHRPDPHRFGRGQRWRPGPLRGPGEGRQPGLVGSDRLRPGLGHGAPPPEHAVVPLRAFRPVALRAGIPRVRQPAREPPRAVRPHHRPPGPGRAAGLAPVLPPVQGEPDQRRAYRPAAGSQDGTGRGRPHRRATADR